MGISAPTFDRRPGRVRGLDDVAEHRAGALAARALADPVRPISLVAPHPGVAALGPSVRNLKEAHFDYDFSRVRVHRDEGAEARAASLAARAFTVGNDIVVGHSSSTAGEFPNAIAAPRSWQMVHDMRLF
jgi:hypothetical protein